MIATVALRRAGADNRALHGYWRHSVAAGFLAVEMAPAWGVHPDHAYMAALLHDPTRWSPCRETPARRRTAAHEGCGCGSLTEMVGLACRMSEALGFPSRLHASTRAGLDELLGALPEMARRNLPDDTGLLARALEEKLNLINN